MVLESKIFKTAILTTQIYKAYINIDMLDRTKKIIKLVRYISASLESLEFLVE
jgi:hypothetical protein